MDFCHYCEEEPFPLRVRSVAFEHNEPERARAPFWDETYPLEWLERAERDGNGPLVDLLLARIEAEQAESGGYPADDPYLETERRARLAMFLELMRSDHEGATWDVLLIHGEPIDLRRLYHPVGGNGYASLAEELSDCPMPEDAPSLVTWEPVDRDPAKEAPPDPYVADITGRCYDGSCPLNVEALVAREEIALYDRPGDDGLPIGTLQAGEHVSPLEVRSHVRPVPAEVLRDHRAYFAGDVLYVLDGLGEGYYHVWHYGRVRVEEVTGIHVSEGWDQCETEEACWARADDRPTETWWVKVRRSDGTAGWVPEPLRHFDGLALQ